MNELLDTIGEGLIGSGLALAISCGLWLLYVIGSRWRAIGKLYELRYIEGWREYSRQQLEQDYDHPGNRGTPEEAAGDRQEARSSYRA